MPDPIDHAATLCAALPPVPLDGLESRVFAAIEDRAREATAARRAGLWSVAAALAIGLTGGGLAAREMAGGAMAARAASPIGIDAMLAPSTLLLGR
ncbi:hypothetical protein [Sphingomonas mollis]|uniref:Dihydroorotate dehydrogenase n=1 Tax=Sphingomonas mollis TaxID=2795726 RepID=A0ABS0XPA0_9SPHN|nr:hypothetical protein [Sphingomonas sp. BT553]MBJ6121871.1 hypothetical protein [Sphingomonas sp. BT553]